MQKVEKMRSEKKRKFRRGRRRKEEGRVWRKKQIKS